jgi:hypothetical protein
VNLSTANLSTANLNAANLNHANLSAALMQLAEKANLNVANLNAANLSAALIQANMNLANMKAANLNASLMQAANDPAYLNDRRQNGQKSNLSAANFVSGTGSTSINSNGSNSGDGDDGSNNGSVDFKDRYKRGKGKHTFQRTKMCMHFLKGWCRAGNECPWAHDNAQLQQRPDLRKTRLCDNFLKGKCHLNGDECVFAHSREELRATEDLYKTMLCRFWLVGNCKAGTSCRHAHGDHELRQKVPQAVAQDVPKAAEVPSPKTKALPPPPGLEFMCEPCVDKEYMCEPINTVQQQKGFRNRNNACVFKDGYPQPPMPANFLPQDPVKIQSYPKKPMDGSLGNIFNYKGYGGLCTNDFASGNQSPNEMLMSNYESYDMDQMPAQVALAALESTDPEPRPCYVPMGFEMQQGHMTEGDPLIEEMLMKLERMKPIFA